MIRVIPIALLSGAVFLHLFLLLFGYSDLFPLGVIDFLFFAVLSFLCALYRPGWAFLLFVSTLSFETINLFPEAFSVSIRPYQLSGAMILAGLFVRFLRDRHSFPFSRPRWFDVLPILFAFGGFLAVFSAPDSASAGKQAVAVLSFVALYFLSRQFLGDASDARRVVPFLLVSSVGATLFALWQSIRFTNGFPSFEVMPGRPNAFFAEPDWLGMFFVFSGSLFLAVMFFRFEKNSLEKEESEMKNQESNKGEDFRMERYFSLLRNSSFLILYALFPVLFLGLLLTVARSAWVGFIFSLVVFLALLLVGKCPWNIREWRWGLFARGSAVIVVSCAFALFLVWAFRLTTFDLGNRAESTVSGMQEITASCVTLVSLPEKIESVSDLSLYGCRHIRLEEIAGEQTAGRFITTTLRPDPSIEARRVIREKTFETLQKYWLFGIGWGGIGDVLGTDERGASFNASNAFLEVWLGGGLLACVSFFVLWMLVPIFAIRMLFCSTPNEGVDLVLRSVAVFFLLTWIGGTFFNLFNSGILLGFLWVWLGGIGMIASRTRD